MNADFKFNPGLEFTSLIQYKDAVIEHSVLNGWEIFFPKNDRTRVLAQCKKKDICKWRVLCSKVGGKQTYSVKTMKGPHTCRRVLNNRTASARCVSSKIIYKVKVARKVTVGEIVDDVMIL